MILIGNDIVALDDRSGRSSQPQFYSKIITSAEKDLFSPERFPHLSLDKFIWLCWAVKEAAFKCLNRTRPGMLFWGPRIRITELSPLSAAPGESVEGAGHSPFTVYSVLAQFDTYFLQAWALVNSEHILAISVPGKVFDVASFGNVHWGVRRIGSTLRERQSAAVREFFSEKLDELYPGQSLTLQKSPEGYPLVCDGSRPLSCGLSFSHHQDLVSYAFLPDQSVLRSVESSFDARESASL